MIKLASIKIFITVGTTPQAVANALAAHLLEIQPSEIVNVYFLVGSTEGSTFPQRTSSNVHQAIQIYKENRENLSLLDQIDVKFHTNVLIDIYEHDLIQNVPLIMNSVDKIIQDGDRVIFEITAGRKAMTGSALLALMLFSKKRANCTFEIAYYWLKHFTHDILRKRLYELGFDSYKCVITSLDDIESMTRSVIQ